MSSQDLIGAIERCGYVDRNGNPLMHSSEWAALKDAVSQGSGSSRYGGFQGLAPRLLGPGTEILEANVTRTIMMGPVKVMTIDVGSAGGGGSADQYGNVVHRSE